MRSGTLARPSSSIRPAPSCTCCAPRPRLVRPLRRSARRRSKYIELEPKDEYGYLNRARIYLSLEKPEKALEDANKAIELKPDEPDGYYRRADVYSALNKDAEAKADEKKGRRAGRQSAPLMPAFNFCPNCAAPLGRSRRRRRAARACRRRLRLRSLRQSDTRRRRDRRA
jgi:tetratricopeptide (TPR) repeat protein